MLFSKLQIYSMQNGNDWHRVNLNRLISLSHQCIGQKHNFDIAVSRNLIELDQR